MSTVLIIDDSTFQRNRLRTTLQEGGYQTLEAGTAEEGLVIIESANPDAVLCDLLMPGMGGLELLRMLQEKSSEVPIVIVTADIQDTVREECMRLGAKGFLTKPPQTAELLAALAAVI